MTLSGSVNVYHNLVHVIGTTTLTDLQFSSGCCTPTGGTITTTFQTGALLSKFNGATETLTITGCGAANYTGPEGYSGSVALDHCF